MRGVEVLFLLLFLMCFLDNELGLQIAETGDGKEPMGQPGRPDARLGSAAHPHTSMTIPWKRDAGQGRREALIGHFSFDNFDGQGRGEEGHRESPKEMLILQPFLTK